MGLFVQSPIAGLIEPAPVAEVTCSGVARIEFVGGDLACFVLYRNTIANGSGEVEPQVCGRIFAPLTAVPGTVDLMMRALVESGAADVAQWGSRLLC